jgi:hypothetical protein
MYVRTWKDTDMVATSDSNPTGSTSDDTTDAAPDAESSASSEGTGSPDASTPPPAATSPAATSASSQTARTADPQTDPPRRTPDRRSGSGVSREQVMSAVSGVRERLAALVWIIAVVFAAILAAGALLIALEANRNNDLVEQVLDWAGGLDGPFRDLFTFDGDNAVKKAALVNWGLAAVAWLVGGRIVSSLIRP